MENVQDDWWVRCEVEGCDWAAHGPGGWQNAAVTEALRGAYVAHYTLLHLVIEF